MRLPRVPSRLRSTVITTPVLLTLIILLILSPPCFAQPAAVAGYAVELFAEGLDGPVELVFDRTGNLYVANEGQPGVTYPGSTISIINRKGAVAVYANGLYGPSGLAFNSQGNLYVSDDTNWVDRAASGQLLSFVYIDNNPNAIAFDKSDNLYVAPYGGDTIFKVTPDGVATPFAGGFVTPAGLAFDSDGYLYVTNQIMGTISKIAPDGTVINSSFAFTGGTPEGLAFAPAGTTPPLPPIAHAKVPQAPTPLRGLFVVVGNAGCIDRVDEVGHVSHFAWGFSGPRRITFSNDGAIYVSEFGINQVFSNKIWKITRRAAQ